MFMETNGVPHSAWAQNVAAERELPYPAQVSQLVDFFNGFKPDYFSAPDRKQSKYVHQLEQINKLLVHDLCVEIDDIFEYFGYQDPLSYSYFSSDVQKFRDLMNTLLSNTCKAVTLVYEAAEHIRSNLPVEANALHRIQAELEDAVQKNTDIPAEFRAPYCVRIIAPKGALPVSVRDIRASSVGGLVKVEAQVSKVSVVRPKLRIAGYVCSECNNYAFQVVDNVSFLPLLDCTSDACRNAKRTHSLVFSPRHSRFLKWQEIKIQELSHQVPAGSVPRIYKAILSGSHTRQLRAGAAITLTGVPCAVIKPSQRATGRFIPDTALLCHHIEQHKHDYMHEPSPDEAREIEELARDSSALYELVAHSIAPAVYGHVDVKKALLLQLVGGSGECLRNGLKIRGDIHMLLVGDPGVAKSQMLSRVCKVAPRAHYTTGKGTSSVGVTASVSKDPITGEFLLEGGATVLADNGICCVDEFDKMDETDRTAIHEVMEQQTVSIAKAGITATLSARTTILAAANPIFGRYDISRSATANIGLPAALLSRFDLQFLMLDCAGKREVDSLMAKHLLLIHKRKRADVGIDNKGHLSNNMIRLIIGKAKTLKPKLPEELISQVRDYYVKLRADNSRGRSYRDESTLVTPRTLLAILRMAQAKSRLRFSDTISSDDVLEAIRLMSESKRSLEQFKVNAKAKFTVMRSDAIMEALKQASLTKGKKSHAGWMDFSNLEQQMNRMGFSTSELLDSVQELIDSGIMKWKDITQQQIGFVDQIHESQNA